MRPVTPRLRVILEVFAGLALIAGCLLSFGATRTDAWWSWTISPPLTAATLGAFYFDRFDLDSLFGVFWMFAYAGLRAAAASSGS